MVVLLRNVKLATGRSSYDAASGRTNAAQTYLSCVEGHAHPLAGQSAYKLLPAGAEESELVVSVESGTDIKTHDVLLSLTLMDGVTPWPGFELLQEGEGPQEAFWVTFAHESTPGPLQARYVYIGRYTASGPTYI